MGVKKKTKQRLFPVQSRAYLIINVYPSLLLSASLTLFRKLFFLPEHQFSNI